MRTLISRILTHLLWKHGGDCQGVHPLRLARAVFAVDFSQAARLDAAAEQKVKVLAACRDFLLLAHVRDKGSAQADKQKKRKGEAGRRTARLSCCQLAIETFKVKRKPSMQAS